MESISKFNQKIDFIEKEKFYEIVDKHNARLTGEQIHCVANGEIPYIMIMIKPDLFYMKKNGLVIDKEFRTFEDAATFASSNISFICKAVNEYSKNGTNNTYDTRDIEVFNSPPHLIGVLAYTKDQIGFLDQHANDYVKVATVKVHYNEITNKMFESAYKLTNNIEHQWTKNEEVICPDEGSAYGYRSTSAGDIIIYENEVYLVDSFGFKNMGSKNSVFKSIFGAINKEETIEFCTNKPCS